MKNDQNYTSLNLEDLTYTDNTANTDPQIRKIEHSKYYSNDIHTTYKKHI